MVTRRSCLALALLMLPAPAWADRHNWEMNMSAVTSSGGSLLWGGNFSLARTIYKDKEGFHRFSGFGDIGVQSGAHEGQSLTRVTGLLGPRVALWRTLKKIAPITGARPEFHYRLQFFTQTPVGWVHTDGENPLAFAPGAGFDGLFSDYGGLRGQVDYVVLKGHKDFWRFSIGVIYRFEHEHPHP
jgi:hypothetical protein